MVHSADYPPPWTECPTIRLDRRESWATRLASLPETAIQAGRALLDELVSQLPPDLRDVGLPDLVRLRTGGRFDDEAQAYAERIGVASDAVLIGNLSYDLTLAALGCSTVVLATPSGPVLARNMDWPMEQLLARTSHLIEVVDRSGRVLANAGWPGAVGVVSGLSGRGFGLVLNAVQADEPLNADGYPVLYFLRRVLEDANDFATAVEMVSNEPLTLGALVTLVGTNNDERVVVERTPTRASLRWGEKGCPLVATNDYRLLRPPETHDGPEIYQTTCLRFDRLGELFDERDESRECSDAELLYALTDAGVFSQITAQHVIMRPASDSIRLFVPTYHLT